MRWRNCSSTSDGASGQAEGMMAKLKRWQPGKKFSQKTPPCRWDRSGTGKLRHPLSIIEKVARIIWVGRKVFFFRDFERERRHVKWVRSNFFGGFRRPARYSNYCPASLSRKTETALSNRKKRCCFFSSQFKVK